MPSLEELQALKKQPPWKFIGLAAVAVITFLVAVLNPPGSEQTAKNNIAHIGIQTVRVQLPRVSYGFFTRNGYIITTDSGLRDAAEVTVILESDNERRQVKARVEKRGSFVPEAILLKLTGASLPQQVLPVRNSTSLQIGYPIERYLAPHDRTPGEVLEVDAQREVWDSSTSKRIIRRALITTSISAPGEAGAPVVDKEGKVVGMVYGGNRKETISIPIEDIKINFPEAF